MHQPPSFYAAAQAVSAFGMPPHNQGPSGYPPPAGKLICTYSDIEFSDTSKFITLIMIIICMTKLWSPRQTLSVKYVYIESECYYLNRVCCYNMYRNVIHGQLCRL